jgi:uncharacterized hydrophobic protein (TIGR00271 family)
VLHLRIVVPTARARPVIDRLLAESGTAHLSVVEDGSLRPPGTLVLCDVAREAANGIVEWLQDEGVHLDGAISMEESNAVVSTSAEAAEREAPGQGSDALVWEELEARVRGDTRLTASFVVFTAIACLLAGIGILIDSPVLVVGAMVVGPEYGPVAAICVAAVRRRPPPALEAAGTLGLGLAAGAVATALATVAYRLVDIAPEDYAPSERQLTAFISQPDALGFVVALLAGVVGMLSLTQVRSSALVGVLVSVTTVPAVANIGVAAAYWERTELLGAAAQLGLNLVGLVGAGIATLAVQDRLTARRGRGDRRT